MRQVEVFCQYCKLRCHRLMSIHLGLYLRQVRRVSQYRQLMEMPWAALRPAWSTTASCKDLLPALPPDGDAIGWHLKEAHRAVRENLR